MRDDLSPLCWDCHAPLGDDAITVPTHGAFPWSHSTTQVCPDCAADRAEWRLR